jgi:DNA-binding transcriptional MerR regulator
MTILEASRMAGCSSSTVRRWLKTGELKGVKEDGIWFVGREDMTLHLHQLSKPFGGLHRPLHGASGAISGDKHVHHEELRGELLEALRREQKINDELRAENKKLQEEIKALLSGKSQGLLSRWRIF